MGVGVTTPSAASHFPFAICHGAPGIALKSGCSISLPGREKKSEASPADPAAIEEAVRTSARRIRFIETQSSRKRALLQSVCLRSKSAPSMKRHLLSIALGLSLIAHAVAQAPGEVHQVPALSPQEELKT